MELAVFLAYISRMRLNEQEAFTIVVRDFGTNLDRALAHHFPGQSEQFREDLAQEAFTEMLRQLPNAEYFAFGSPELFYSFLQSVAFRRGYDCLKVDRRVACALKDKLSSTPPAGSVDEKLIEDEIAILIAEALAEEPDEDRAMYHAHHCDQETYKQIAGRFGYPIGTVQSRIHRCRVRVRDRVARGLSVDNHLQ